MATSIESVSAKKDLAIIGAGYWGKNLARNFASLGVLHSICDQHQATLSAYEEQYPGVKCVRKTDDVLGNPAIGKVVIAAPAAQHGALVKAALEAGKDVFVEKPLCLDVAEGARLSRLAQDRGRILMVGHLLQYHPCIERLRAIVDGGELGKLFYITSNRLNLGKIRHEENALWSFAPHDLSVIISLAGSELPEQVQCQGKAYLNEGVADSTLTSLRFRGSLRAHIYVSWLNPFKEQKLTVVGSKGMAVFDDRLPWSEKLTLYRDYLTWSEGKTPVPSNAKAERVEMAEQEPLKLECQHFLTACQSRTNPRTDGEEGVRVLSVLSMAQASLDRDGEAITFPAADACSSPDLSENSSGECESESPQAQFFVHKSAAVDPGAMIGEGTKVWHFSHVMPGAQIGRRCVLGQNVNVDGGAIIGDNVKIQNNVSVYSGVTVEDDVFLGPSCVLTNVTNPRSQVNRHRIYETTLIGKGATIGANATIVCGVKIGRYAFIGAGTVVTRDVPAYALIVGNPGKQRGWMSRHGHVLSEPDDDGKMTCPESGLRYQIIQREGEGTASVTGKNSGLSLLERSLTDPLSYQLTSLDLKEESPLPEGLSVGEATYREFHRSKNEAESSS